MDYKDTLNMMKTDFPMRANLPQREPEILKGWYDGELYEKLMEKGAKDVIFIPAFGKKNRPLYVVNIMAYEEDKDDIIHTLFQYSSTIGMRVEKVNRVTAERDFIEREVMGEKIRLKRIRYEEIERFSPEWEDCKKAAEKLNMTPYEIMNKVMQ